MAKECLVIPTEVLIQEKVLPSNQGEEALYIPLVDVGGVENIYRLAALYGEYRERFGPDGIENDRAFQQLIMYAFVIKDFSFLAYQRGSTEKGDYDENRLEGKVSLGLGGHMERTDLALADSLFREVNEEALAVTGDQVVNFRDESDRLDLELMRRSLSICPVGLIKDNDDVGLVHLGIACRLTPKNPNTDMRVGTTGENINYRYVTVGEYQSLAQSGQITPEGWSNIVFRNEIQPNLSLLTPPVYNPKFL